MTICELCEIDCVCEPTPEDEAAEDSAYAMVVALIDALYGPRPRGEDRDD